MLQKSICSDPSAFISTGCSVRTKAVLLKSSIRWNFPSVYLFKTDVDGWQKNSPSLGAGAVKMMQAINHADGILVKKINKTVRSCHLPNSPLIRPIISIFSILLSPNDSTELELSVDKSGLQFILLEHWVDDDSCGSHSRSSRLHWRSSDFLSESAYICFKSKCWNCFNFNKN